MAPSNTRRLLLALNLMAGLPFGIFFEVMPTYMRTVHCSLTDIGLMAVAQFPWSLKVLWSPFIDRWGRLDRWLRASHLALALIFVALAWRDVAYTGVPGPALILPLMVLLATAAAVQDTVSDATYVQVIQDVPVSMRAGASSLRISAYKVALMGGSGAAIVVGASYGWAKSFLVMALIFAISALLLPPHLRQIAAQPPQTFKDFSRSLSAWLRAPGARGSFAYILIYKVGLATLSPMTKPYWVDRGIDAVWLGGLNGTLGLAGTVTGALLVGLVGRRGSIVTPLVVGSFAETLACLGYAIAVYLPATTAILAACTLAEALAQGMATSALILFLAQICDRTQAATQFAALTATFAVTRILGGVVGGAAAEALGYPLFFTLLPFLCLWSLMLLPQVRQRLLSAAAAADSDAATST